MSEQEEAENSREEKRTEEHLESGKQEEEKLATRLLSPPNLPPLLLLKLLLAACCPSTLAKPLPWELSEVPNVKEVEPEPRELAMLDTDPWNEAEAEDFPKLIWASATSAKLAKMTKPARILIIRLSS